MLRRGIGGVLGSRAKVWLCLVGLLVQTTLLTSAVQATEKLCAVVKIEIQQELSLERQAFEATMRITNRDVTGAGVAA